MDPILDTEVHTVVGSNIKSANYSEELLNFANDCHKRSRAWFITINNYTEEEIHALKTDSWIYIMFQFEIGELCGTPHVHAFIYYKNARVWPKHRYPRAYIARPFNIDACIEYCSKEDTRVDGPYEWGERPSQGRRKDLEQLSRMILNKELTLQEFAQEDPVSFVRYNKGLTILETMTFSHRSNPPTVLWYWGLAGTGKTKAAVEIDASFYIKDGTQWWDGYKQQKVIIIDDFDGKWPYRDLLRLLDRYPYQGQIKGGYVPINSDFIVITCEHPPHEFWQGNELEQVSRRLTAIRMWVKDA